ncbi:unnamed protein product, partial [Brassica oleracea]
CLISLKFLGIYGMNRGNKGIVRRRHWDSISKKGVKGFGWILVILEIKRGLILSYVRLGLLRLSQTNLEKIQSYQGMIFLIHQRKGSK